MHESNSKIALLAAKQERSRRYSLLQAQGYKRSDTSVDIVIHSIRRRRIDVFNTSEKAAIDGLVRAGILFDDGPNQVATGKFTQEIGKEECTIITISDE